MISEGSLTSWLYRPYIDLTPEAPEGNPQTKGLLIALEAVKDETERARIHGLYPSSWREEMVRQSRLPAVFSLSDPLSLPEELRTTGWEMLCEYLSAMEDLSAMPVSATAQSVRVLWLLHRMLLGRAVLAYSQEPVDLTDELYAQTALLRAMARSSLGSENEGYERIVSRAQPGSWSAIEASYFLSAIAAKYNGNALLVRHWTDEHRRQIELAELNEHDRVKLRSRYHRARAFVPQLEKDLIGMAREMDHAEEYAKQMLRDTEDHETEARTLSFAMWESRTKEALIVGDFDLAEERSRAAVEEAPLRAAGHLAVGQVLFEKGDYELAIEPYRTAARYGPPDTEVAWFMAGQCFEEVEAYDAARDAYLAALDADPLGTASLERVITVANNMKDAVLRRWAEERLNILGSTEPEKIHAYQQYEGKLGQ